MNKCHMLNANDEGCQGNTGLGTSHKLVVQGDFSEELITKLELELDTHPNPEPPILFLWAFFMSELSIT